MYFESYKGTQYIAKLLLAQTQIQKTQYSYFKNLNHKGI